MADLVQKEKIRICSMDARPGVQVIVATNALE
jgi:hypothetical protein